jgi:integrase
MNFLTSDNPPLSEPKDAADDPREINCTERSESMASQVGDEINFTEHDLVRTRPSAGRREDDRDCEINFTEPLPDAVAHFVRHSLTRNTWRAYQFDLKHFEAWGGRIPCDPQTVASYLADQAGKLAVASLERRLAAITKAHDAVDRASPTRSFLVRATLRGIRRQFGIKQQEAKPLTRNDIFRVLDAIGEGTRDLRDRCLLLIGFAAGLRRSEIVALNASDVRAERQGLIIHLNRSKTDQEGAGRNIGIPYGRTRYCAVATLERWRERAAIVDGPIFRPVDRHGRVASERLSAEAVSVLVKKRVIAIGFNETGYSGHSLRAGFATSAALAGAPPWRIRKQTGHASDAMLARYVRDSELFTDNAADALL